MVGVVWGLVSAITWAISNISIQPAAERYGDLGALLQGQLAGALLAVGAALLLDGAPVVPTATAALGCLVGGAAATIAYLGLFTALRRGQLAVVIPLTSAWTVVSVLIGALGLGERLGQGAWLGVAAVIAGNVTLAVAQHHSTPSPNGAPCPPASADGRKTPWSAIAWAVAAAVGFGVMVPAVDVVGEACGRLWAIPMVWLVEWSWVGMVWVLYRTTGMASGLFTSARWVRDIEGARLIGRVGLLEVVGFITLSIGIGVAPVAVVAPVASLSTGLSVVWGVWGRGERLSLAAMGGAALVSLGVVLVSV